MTKTDTTIIIDGQHYDAITGLPVSIPKIQPSQKVTLSVKPAGSLHSTPQRSVTLHRKTVKKPTPLKHTIVGRSQTKHMDIARPRHSAVSRFAPHPVGALKKTPKSIDISPVAHPHVTKAHTLSAAKQPLARTIASSSIKDHAIKNAVKSAQKNKKPFKSRLAPRQRIAAVLSASLAVVILGGYITYLNMPALSVRVAAAQAGIDASYPNYRPDGYALNGPVTYSESKVAMNFKANGGEQRFTLSQSKSGWNSEALLDNYVSPKAGSDYVPYTERGLTIYTYGNNAAWINGGIMYTIEGDAPLSNSQMRRIATSLL